MTLKEGLEGLHASYWVRTTPSTSYPELRGDVAVDVGIIGGGLVGLTLATLLKAAGLTVAVVERARVAERVSGHTTAKITSNHGIFYHDLIERFGATAPGSMPMPISRPLN